MFTARTAVAAAVAGIDTDGRQWIEVLPVAEKVRNGPDQFFTLTAADLDVLAASIREKGDQTPLDYDHSYVERGDTRAAGWFTGGAEVRDTDGGPRLYAEVQWTPSAIEAIEAREYRFISAEWSFSSKDSKTGLWTKAKEFLAATLTNRPFFPQLKPVTAADNGGVVWSPEDGYQQLQQEVYEALNPGPPDSARYWVCDIAAAGDRALIQEYGGDQRTWVVPFTRTGDADGVTGYDIELAPSDEWVEAEQQWVDAGNTAAAAIRKTRPFTEGDIDMSDYKALAAELGLAEDATEEQVIAAVRSTKEKADNAPADGAVVLTKETVETLTASAAKGEQAFAELESLKINTMLDGAVRDFKILPVQKEAYAAMAAADFDRVKKLIDDTPKDALKLATSGKGGDTDSTDDDVDSKKVKATRRRFSSDLAADAPVEQAQLHVKAMAILGKSEYTADEYLAAYAQAESELGIEYVADRDDD